MKPINENRLIELQKYIKDYFTAHHAYPTYRQIKDDNNYSSLSLINKDIERLKQRGIVASDNYEQVRLTEFKREVKYDYSFIIMTDAFKYLDLLEENEKLLLESQDNYLKGNYELANEQADYLLANCKDQNVRIGAMFSKCSAAMFTGNDKPWREIFRGLVTYDCKTLGEKMEKELLSTFLSNSIGGKEPCPSWLIEGRFYGLRESAMPLAKLGYVANVIKTNNQISPRYLEPLCATSMYGTADIVQVYLDLYLALSYHYAGDDKYLKEHIKGAIKTCLKHDWLVPLAEMKRPLESVISPILEEYDGLLEKVYDLQTKLMHGYTKLYDSLVGEDPVKGMTFREIEICNYVRLGFQTKEIADKLYLSPETIKYYLSSIYLKLGVSSRKELRSIINKAIVK